MFETPTIVEGREPDNDSDNDIWRRAGVGPTPVVTTSLPNGRVCMMVRGTITPARRTNLDDDLDLLLRDDQGNPSRDVPSFTWQECGKRDPYADTRARRVRIVDSSNTTVDDDRSGHITVVLTATPIRHDAEWVAFWAGPLSNARWPPTVRFVVRGADGVEHSSAPFNPTSDRGIRGSGSPCSRNQHTTGVCGAMAQHIKHVIVLMLENRSFDHMLGFLKSSAYPIDGLNGDEDNPSADFPNPVRVEAIAADETEGDPRHGHPDTNEQLYLKLDGPPLPPGQKSNKGFVKNYRRHASPDESKEVMYCFDAQRLPVLSGLAKAYAVCDHWYSSANSSAMHEMGGCLTIRSLSRNISGYLARLTINTRRTA